jgi:hypothetical protein
VARWLILVSLDLMRAVHAIPWLAVVLFGSCVQVQPAKPIEAPVRLREHASADIPFSITEAGTYDIQLYYPRNIIAGYVQDRLLGELAGSATLRAGNKKLEWPLPTGWFRSSSGMVLRRFHAYANTQYVLTLHITRLPPELKSIYGVVRVDRWGVHSHPGHHVYELQ